MKIITETTHSQRMFLVARKLNSKIPSDQTSVNIVRWCVSNQSGIRGITIGAKRRSSGDRNDVFVFCAPANSDDSIIISLSIVLCYGLGQSKEQAAEVLK